MALEKVEVRPSGELNDLQPFHLFHYYTATAPEIAPEQTSSENFRMIVS